MRIVKMLFLQRLIKATAVVLAGVVIAALSSFLVANTTVAQPPPKCGDDEQQLSIGLPNPDNPSDTIDCVPKNALDLFSNPIYLLLKSLLVFMVGGVILAAVGGVIYGGIMRIAANGNPQQLQKADEIIRNAIIAVILFVFMYSIINFLIPGKILL